MDLEPPTDLLHGLNRIRCNGSRIMVGSRDFTSASEALEAYLDQYAGIQELTLPIDYTLSGKQVKFLWGFKELYIAHSAGISELSLPLFSESLEAYQAILKVNWIYFWGLIKNLTCTSIQVREAGFPSCHNNHNNQVFCRHLFISLFLYRPDLKTQRSLPSERLWPLGPKVPASPDGRPVATDRGQGYPCRAQVGDRQGVYQWIVRQDEAKHGSEGRR